MVSWEAISVRRLRRTYCNTTTLLLKHGAQVAIGPVPFGLAAMRVARLHILELLKGLGGSFHERLRHDVGF